MKIICQSMTGLTPRRHFYPTFGTVPCGTELYMGTAALSERDYVHDAIDQADLIITIGHDTSEKPPFIMTANRPLVCHVAYQPATVEQSDPPGSWFRRLDPSDRGFVVADFERPSLIRQIAAPPWCISQSEDSRRSGMVCLS